MSSDMSLTDPIGDICRAKIVAAKPTFGSLFAGSVCYGLEPHCRNRAFRAANAGSVLK